MKPFLVVFFLFFFVAAEDKMDSSVEGSYEEVLYKLNRWTVATPTHQSQSLFEKFKHGFITKMKKYCDMQSPKAHDKLKVAFGDYIECIQLVAATVDWTKNSSGVVKKVCGASPQYLSCFDKFMDGAKPCFNEWDIRASVKGIPAVHDMVNHLCYQDGLRVTNFIRNGGRACVSQKKNDIVACFNSTRRLDTPRELYSFFFINLVTNCFLPESCKKIAELQTCTKSKLENCSTSTAADLFGGMMESMKNTICKKYHIFKCRDNIEN